MIIWSDSNIIYYYTHILSPLWYKLLIVYIKVFILRIDLSSNFHKKKKGVVHNYKHFHKRTNRTLGGGGK